MPHGPLPERLDRVVERARALHRPVGELPGEGTVAVVETADGAAKRAVGVGVLLEDAAEDVERRARRAGATHRSPRSHASYVHPPAAVRLHLDRLERSVRRRRVHARR